MAENKHKAPRLRLTAAVVVLFSLSVAGYEIDSPPLVVYESTFDQLVRHVQSTDDSQRREFAYLAISEMLIEHEAALQAVAVRKTRTKEAASKIARWTSATRHYVEEMAWLLESLDSAYRVDVYYGRAGTTQIVIDHKPVLISSIDIREPSNLEHAIVTTFCAYNDCRFLSTERAVDGIGALRTHPGAGWSFADGSLVTFASGDGLHFMFTNIDHRADKERVCLMIIDELRTLVQWLRHTVNDGHTIDWNALRVEDNRVVINTSGGFIRLPLPALNRSPALVTMALPWIKARVAGKTYEKFFPGSELMFAELLASRT